MSIYYQDPQVTLYHGDCIEVLATLPDASVDAVVTDPPYGLEFMGKGWDAPWKTGNGFRRADNAADAGRETVFGRSSRTSPEYVAGKGFQHWCEQWAAECLRVLKPGGHMVAFGGTRTFHRLTAGIEDAGFEIRDVLSWLYGSGFPKSRNIGPETGGAWEGWGTALKPAWEPIVLARKPLASTVAGNVLAHGTGAINVDACRIGYTSEADKASAVPQGRATARPGNLAGKAQAWESSTTATETSTTASMTDTPANPSPTSASTAHGTARREFTPNRSDAGRFPANVLLDDTAAAALDAQTGTLKSGILAAHHQRAAKTGGVLGDYASQPGARGYGDEGGASRFFYSAKADAAERPVVDGVAHPTVKPLALMEWLLRLVTPPGGTVLEPFAGSGTTLEAAQYTEHPAIGIEKGDEYLPLIRYRLERADPRIKVAKPAEVHEDQLDMLALLDTPA